MINGIRCCGAMTTAPAARALAQALHGVMSTYRARLNVLVCLALALPQVRKAILGVQSVGLYLLSTSSAVMSASHIDKHASLTNHCNSIHLLKMLPEHPQAA